MPVTLLTEFCTQCHAILRELNQFAVEVIKPNILAVRDDQSRTDQKRDTAIAGTYLQITIWLGSLGKLHNTSDFLAIGSGSRAIYELDIDLRWLNKFTDPIWGERYWAYPEVNRYKVAEKIVDHKTKTPSSTIDVGVFQPWVAAKAKFEALVSKVWGITKGKPKWPGHHWTGEGDLRTRSVKIDPFYEDMYLQLYPVLSWLVHAGPNAYMAGNFAEMEKYIGHAYFFAALNALDATIVTGAALGIDHKIEGFEEFFQSINAKLDAAKRLITNF